MYQDEKVREALAQNGFLERLRQGLPECRRRTVLRGDPRPSGRAAGFVVLMLSAVLIWLALADTAGAQVLRSPVRLAQLPSGHLLVTDNRLKEVAEWDPNQGAVVGMFSIPGRPVGIAWGWGRVLVGNDVSQSVEVYSPVGRFRYTLGGAAGQIGRPSDIALDIDQGLVFVSDAKGGRVVVYSYDGQFLRTLPAPGQTPLIEPTGLAVDPLRGEVLVSDFGQPSSFSSRAWVRIYDYYGNYLAGISGNALSGYQFSRPQGLAVNTQGLIYLVDSLLGQVLVFDRSSLQGVATVGEIGADPGQLLHPLDATINQDTGDLYVTNNDHGTVEVFKGKGLLP